MLYLLYIYLLFSVVPSLTPQPHQLGFLIVCYRLRSDLVPEYGAREQFLMGTNVNTPFFQVPAPEFGQIARAQVQGLDLVLGH